LEGVDHIASWRAGRDKVSKHLNKGIGMRTEKTCDSKVRPNNLDILCGKGKVAAAHPGNRRLRKIVEKYYIWYTAMSTKTEKMKVAEKVVAEVMAEESGCTPRFLKKDPIFEVYYVATSKAGVDKILYHLRMLAKQQARRQGGLKTGSFGHNQQSSNSQSLDSTSSYSSRNEKRKLLHASSLECNTVPPSTEETNEGLKTTVVLIALEMYRRKRRKLQYDSLLNECSNVMAQASLKVLEGLDDEGGNTHTAAVPEVVGFNEKLDFESMSDTRYSDDALAVVPQAVPTFGVASTTPSSQWWLSKASFTSFGPHSSQQNNSATESRNRRMQQTPPAEAGLDSMLSRFWDFQQDTIEEREDWVPGGMRGAPLPLPVVRDRERSRRSTSI
jgi:hypothetical protein